MYIKENCIDPNYIQAKALYEKAEDYEREGKPNEFTETYLKTLELEKQAFEKLLLYYLEKIDPSYALDLKSCLPI